MPPVPGALTVQPVGLGVVGLGVVGLVEGEVDGGLEGGGVTADLAQERLPLLVASHHVVPQGHVRLGLVTAHVAHLGSTNQTNKCRLYF